MQTPNYILLSDSIAVSLYPFGAGNGDQVLASGDNSNSGVVSLTTPAIFYGKSVDKIIVRTSKYMHCNIILL
jgi:hypothetical protein